MGNVSLGDYDLVEAVGAGGLADVWSARHRADGRTVAVKFMRDGATDDNEMARAAFRDEIEAVASLDHPHIVRLLDFGDVPVEVADRFDGRVPAGSPYLVLEYVGGGSVETAAGPPNWPTLRDALAALLGALAHSHARGLAHRDIKPANVLLPLGPDPWRGLKLSDFGTAHQHRVTQVGDLDRRFAGTLTWTAPEQVRGEWRDFGPWTDLYALGCVAYYLATGAAPFQAEHWAGLMDLQLNHPPAPMRLTCPAPAPFEGWVRQLLAKDPADRFRTAAEARRALLSLDGPTLPLSSSYPDRETAPPEGAGLALLTSRRLPLVSRRLERAIVWESLHTTATQSRPRGVLIRGASGVGKTRLAQWLCETAHEHAGFDTVHLVHESPPGRRHGLGPMVTRTLRLAGLDHDGARDRIAARLDLGEDADWAADGLAALVLGGDQVAGDGPSLAATFVRALASRRPTILCIEDVHYGLDSLRFAEALLNDAQANRLPLLVLLTATDTGAPDERLSNFCTAMGVQSVTLDPMTAEDREELLDAILPFDAATRARLAMARDAPAHRLTRQVADWARNGDLVSDGHGAFQLAPHVVPAATASQFMAAVDLSAPLDDLDPDELTCVGFAAVLGETVGLQEWSWCCRAAGTLGMPRALDALYRVPLARREERGFTFLSGHTRQLVLDRLRADGQWRAAHEVCATALAQHAPGDPRVGRFWLEAGQLDLGGDLILLAARRYNTIGELGAALGELDRLDASMADIDHPRRLQGHLLRVDVLIERGEMEPARQWAQHVAARAEATGQRDLALTARLRQAQALAYEGDSITALTIARSVAAQTDAGHGEPRTRAFAQRVLGLHLAQLGQTDEAEKRLQESLDVYTRLGDVVGEINLLHHLAYLRIRQGNLSTAESHARLGIELAETAGYGKVLMHLVMCLGEVARARGDLDQAFTFYERARALQIQRGGRPYASSLNLAIVCLLRREYTRAAQCAREGAQIVRGSLAALSALLMMPAAAEAGDHEAWDALWNKVCAESDEHALTEPDFAVVAEHVGIAAIEHGATSRAHAVLRFAGDIYTRLGRPADAQRVSAALAVAAAGV